MTQRINTETDPRETCRLFLELVRKDGEQVRRTRDHYIGLAHKYGMPNTEIGEAVGLTEARVRQVLADGAA